MIVSLFVDFTPIFGPYPTTCEEMVSYEDDSNYQLYVGEIYKCSGDLTAYGYPDTSVAEFCCQSCPKNCGDNVCNFDETVASCYLDCGPGTLEEALTEKGNFTTLLQVLKATGVDLTLANYSQLTLFAPTDAAFENALGPIFNASSVEEFLDSLDQVPALPKILQYHLLEGAFSLEEIKAFDALETLTFPPLDLQVVLKNTGVFLNNNVKIIDPDIPATNGVIHVIDTVLFVYGQF